MPDRGAAPLQNTINWPCLGIKNACVGLINSVIGPTADSWSNGRRFGELRLFIFRYMKFFFFFVSPLNPKFVAWNKVDKSRLWAWIADETETNVNWCIGEKHPRINKPKSQTVRQMASQDANIFFRMLFTCLKCENKGRVRCIKKLFPGVLPQGRLPTPQLLSLLCSSMPDLMISAQCSPTKIPPVFPLRVGKKKNNASIIIVIFFFKFYYLFVKVRQFLYLMCGTDSSKLQPK